jgi:cell division protein FtsB
MNIQEIQTIANQLDLTLDSLQSVKLQVKQINLAQKQLRAIKKEINAHIRQINQDASQAYSDSIVSVGLDIFGKNKWAGRVRAETRRMIERNKKDARQPYMELKDYIDQLILEGDKLKLSAEQYLLSRE